MSRADAAKMPSSPSGLGTAGRRLWRSVWANLEPSAPWELEVVAEACRHLDRAAECREVIRTEGLTLTDARGSAKAHPLLAVEVNATRTMAQLLGAVGVKAAPARDSRGRLVSVAV
jgi:P27 family predicted phage terminase small subunit